MRYTLLSAQGIKLSCKAPFVKFEWLVLELPAANQRVSNSVFSVSSYILVLRSRITVYVSLVPLKILNVCVNATHCQEKKPWLCKWFWHNQIVSTPTIPFLSPLFSSILFYLQYQCRHKYVTYLRIWSDSCSTSLMAWTLPTHTFCSLVLWKQ